MDGLGAAASVIAVGKVASLLFQYSKDVKHAKDDIARLRQEASNLKNASDSVERLLKGPNGSILAASQELTAAFRVSVSQLEELEQKLSPGKTRKAMSRVRIRTLKKWPLESEDVENTVQNLARCTQVISRALQVDQMTVSVPLHSYSSDLAFAPEKSLVQNAYKSTIPSWVTLLPDYWDHGLQVLNGHSRWVNSVAFSHDSTLIASASGDGTVRICRTDTSDCVHELKGHSHSVNSVAFSYDSALIVSASDDETVRICRTDTSDCVHELKGHSGWVNSVAFSHDSSLIASASSDETVRIWRVDTSDCIHELKGHISWVNSVAFSHDSALIISASSDETVRIWRTDAGDCVHELKGHNGSVNSAVFSHDSALIVSASGDGVVRIWRADMGDCVRELKGHNAWVSSVAFSHDSSLIVSASGDGTARIWRADAGDCIRALCSYGPSFSSVTFSHDSALIASASDQTVQIWHPDTDDCIQKPKGHRRWSPIQSEPIAPASSGTCMKFLDPPLEIRELVWEHSLLDVRLFHVHQIQNFHLQPSTADNIRSTRRPESNAAPLRPAPLARIHFDINYGPPVATQVCSESRTAASAPAASSSPSSGRPTKGARAPSVGSSTRPSRAGRTSNLTSGSTRAPTSSTSTATTVALSNISKYASFH